MLLLLLLCHRSDHAHTVAAIERRQRCRCRRRRLRRLTSTACCSTTESAGKCPAIIVVHSLTQPVSNSCAVSPQRTQIQCKSWR